MSYDAFYEKLEENTFVAVILKHPVAKMGECPHFPSNMA